MHSGGSSNTSPNSTSNGTDATGKLETMSVRLAGVDAPECAHFGAPAQPFSQEARQWLADTILGKMVQITLLRIDIYGRVIATTHVHHKPHRTRTNVSLKMVELGLAVVFEGAGAEYGTARGAYDELKEAERVAIGKRVGMWSLLPDRTSILVGNDDDSGGQREKKEGLGDEKGGRMLGMKVGMDKSTMDMGMLDTPAAFKRRWRDARKSAGVDQ
ncbi:putative endonuclease lcl3 [Phlyctochytrium planicorne]|nr:putative endonuclease lcl3 [Phlyctochytrium planicorne]